MVTIEVVIIDLVGVRTNPVAKLDAGSAIVQSKRHRSLRRRRMRIMAGGDGILVEPTSQLLM